MKKQANYFMLHCYHILKAHLSSDDVFHFLTFCLSVLHRKLDFRYSSLSFVRFSWDTTKDIHWIILQNFARANLLLEYGR